MATEWIEDPELPGRWTCFGVGDGTVDAELYEDEVESWPPYAQARRTANLAARLAELLGALELADDDPRPVSTILAQQGLDAVLEGLIAELEREAAGTTVVPLRRTGGPG